MDVKLGFLEELRMEPGNVRVRTWRLAEDRAPKPA